MIHAVAQEGEDQPSWLNSSQQDPFSNVNQQLFGDYTIPVPFVALNFEQIISLVYPRVMLRILQMI